MDDQEEGVEEIADGEVLQEPRQPRKAIMPHLDEFDPAVGWTPSELDLHPAHPERRDPAAP